MRDSRNIAGLPAKRYWRSLLLAGLLAVVPWSNVDAGTAPPKYLPITKTGVVEIALATLHPETLTANSINVSADQRSGIDPDDKVWALQNKGMPLAIFMAGPDEHIHSLHVYFPVVNNSEEQNARGMAFLSSLFSHIYPNWPEAKDWPKSSANSAWSVSSLVTNQAQKNLNDNVIKKSTNGITSSTIGVPPDLFVFSITVKDQCVPYATKYNPFQRIVC